MQEYFEHDEILTPCFSKISEMLFFFFNELVKWIYEGHFRLTNEILNLCNFFIHSLALKYMFITAF